jgi:hypothetical protein
MRQQSLFTKKMLKIVFVDINFGNKKGLVMFLINFYLIDLVKFIVRFDHQDVD